MDAIRGRTSSLFHKAAIQGANEAPYVDIVRASRQKALLSPWLLMPVIFATIASLIILFRTTVPISFRSELFVSSVTPPVAGRCNDGELNPLQVWESRVPPEFATTIRVGDRVTVQFSPVWKINLADATIAAIQSPQVASSFSLAFICMPIRSLGEHPVSGQAHAFFTIRRLRLIDLLLGKKTLGS
ncbi:hypothetical protein C7477_12142 [Phyllobacterium leguminum]|uniref:Uncharacterized protein n=1 Tax=Phyllobacterium leguminum TaxID=314237 RepID=A0A318SZ84_9HYPH|nr:hypothetical protein C7477_12142 [Phyllobacterium leguminum]